MKEIQPIITSILDSDMYKFSMQNAALKLFPNLKVKYAFTDRSNIDYPEGFDVELRKQLEHLKALRLTAEEKDFLKTDCPYLDAAYRDFLSGYQYDPTEVGVMLKDNKLSIEISGYWYRTILWEVPLMAIVSELYFIMTGQAPIDRADRQKNNTSKASTFQMNNVLVSDFGTRRRFSYQVQDELVADMVGSYNSKQFFMGTSNVHFAMKYGIKAIGTHAHEFFMVHAALYGFKMANYLALENWVKVYDGDLGIALTDTLTTDVFFKSFNKKFARLFDGVRQDSADPYLFADKTVAHYKSLGIDHASKVIVFSNALTTKEAVPLSDYTKKLGIKPRMGIGTHFTNDVGVKPLNIVIKVVSVEVLGEWVPAVKLSDESGKHSGNAEMIDLAQRMLNIKS